MPTAYLWCPAYPLGSAAAVTAAETRARELLAGTPYTLVTSPRLGEVGPPGSWADIVRRQEDLARGLEHDLLIAARGGYGCISLLGTIASHARLPGLVGYSDLTVFHAAWRRRGQEPWSTSSWNPGPPATVYGAMPGIPGGDRSLTTTRALLRGEPVTIDPTLAPQARVVRSGSVEAPLFVGCLRVLASLIGSAAMPSLAGCILALEDVDERPYQVDRDLHQLANAGALDGVCGLLFGTFPCTLPADYQGPTTAAILEAWAHRLAVPALTDLPFGHDPDPLSLPCSQPITLITSGSEWRLNVPATS